MTTLRKQRFYTSCGTTSNINIGDLYDSLVFKDIVDYATTTQCGITFLSTDNAALLRTAYTANNPRAVQPHQIPTISGLVSTTQTESLSGIAAISTDDGLYIEQKTVTTGGISRNTYLLKCLTAITSTTLTVTGDNKTGWHIEMPNSYIPGQIDYDGTGHYGYFADMINPNVIYKDPQDLISIKKDNTGAGTSLTDSVNGLNISLLYDSTQFSISEINKLTLLNSSSYVKTTGNFTLGGTIAVTNPLTVGIATTSGHALTYGQYLTNKETTDLAIGDVVKSVNDIEDLIALYTTISFTSVNLIATTSIKAGTGAPNLACLEFTSATKAVEGEVTNIAHGLPGSNIRSCDVMVFSSSNIPIMKDNIGTGLQYSVDIDGTNVIVTLHATNSENILSKTIKVLIWYNTNMA